VFLEEGFRCPLHIQASQATQQYGRACVRGQVGTLLPRAQRLRDTLLMRDQRRTSPLARR
jgi:hypothetical protein